MEIAKSLFHGRVLESTILVRDQVVSGLDDAEGQTLFAEPQVFGWDVAIKEDVDAFSDRRWESDDSIDGWSAIKYADEIGKVVQNRQVMLYNNNIVIRSEKFSDGSGSSETLLYIEIGGRFVEHVDISVLDADECESETLKFSTGQQSNLTILNLVEFEYIHDMFHVAKLVFCLDERLDGFDRTFDGAGKLINILRLDDRLQIVFEYLGEIVLELGSSEIAQNLLPVGRIGVSPKVGFELSRQNLQRRAFANTVCSHKSKHLTRSWRRQTMKLEAVG